MKARELGLTGATVIREMTWLGSATHSQGADPIKLKLLSEQPVVVEIVGTEDKLQQLLPFIDEIVPDGQITLADVNVVLWRRTK